MFRELFGVGIDDVMSWTLERYDYHRNYADAVLRWRGMAIK